MNMKDIGAMVRGRRLELGIEQRDLGEISGVAVHTLSNIETGKGNPSAGTLGRVADALGLELVLKVKE